MSKCLTVSISDSPHWMASRWNWQKTTCPICPPPQCPTVQWPWRRSPLALLWCLKPRLPCVWNTGECRMYHRFLSSWLRPGVAIIMSEAFVNDSVAVFVPVHEAWDRSTCLKYFWMVVSIFVLVIEASVVKYMPEPVLNGSVSILNYCPWCFKPGVAQDVREAFLPEAKVAMCLKHHFWMAVLVSIFNCLCAWRQCCQI